MECCRVQVPREANHHFLREPCVVRRQAKRWGAAGWAIEPRDALKPECRGRPSGQHPASRVGEGGSAGSENHGRSRDLGGLAPLSWRGRRGKELFHKPMMNEKSDPAIVPLKAANKGSSEPAELLEGRAMRLARAARRSGGHRRLNAGSEEEPGRASLLHHVTVDALHDAFHSLRKDAAAGRCVASVCGGCGTACTPVCTGVRTGRLQGLHTQGGWRATTACLGQDSSAGSVILVPLYETEFLGFSYGFRPGRITRSTPSRWNGGRSTGSLTPAGSSTISTATT